MLLMLLISIIMCFNYAHSLLLDMISSYSLIFLLSFKLSCINCVDISSLLDTSVLLLFTPLITKSLSIMAFCSISICLFDSLSTTEHDDVDFPELSLSISSFSFSMYLSSLSAFPTNIFTLDASPFLYSLYSFSNIASLEHNAASFDFACLVSSCYLICILLFLCLQ